MQEIEKYIKAFNNTDNEDKHRSSVIELTDMLEQKILNQISVVFSRRRKEKNMSVRELNHKSLVSLAVINDLEKVRSMPRVETLIRLSLSLGISFNDLFRKMIIPEYDLVDYKSTSNLENKQDLATSIASFGYNKDQVAEIMDFIKFVDYKSKQW